MRQRISKRLLKHGLLLSLLLHILFLLALTTVYFLQPEEQKKPPQIYEVPAYLYKGAIKPSMEKPAEQAQQQRSEQTQEQTAQQETAGKEHEKAIALEHNPSPTPMREHTSKPTHHLPRVQSMLAASFEALKQDQLQQLTKKQSAEPILMIGDENTPSDPLIRLIGRALSANFHYPKTEGMMGIRGRVVVELTINPNGTFSDISMMRSSNNPNLDAAALYAANSAPTIYGVDRFLKAPRHIVVGFIFY